MSIKILDDPFQYPEVVRQREKEERAAKKKPGDMRGRGLQHRPGRPKSHKKTVYFKVIVLKTDEVELLVKLNELRIEYGNRCH